MRAAKLTGSYFAILGALALGLGAQPASAITVCAPGTNVTFCYDNALMGLFGAPTVAGDTIFWTPTSFSAQSLNGVGLVITNQTINVSVMSNDPNYRFTSVSLLERGDYQLRGAGSLVDVGGQLRVIDELNPPAGGPEVTDFLALNGALPLTINDGAFHNWEGTAFADLSAAAWDNTSKIRVTIENILAAYTEPTATGIRSAFVEKKFASSTVGITVNPIPIPAAVWLFGAALGVLTLVRRRAA